MDTTVNQITVLLPVFNAEEHLAESISSILNQSYRHFELLIINDGSHDSSEAIIRGFDDPRVRFINKEQNTGLIDTLNLGLQEINTRYIARMDADDIAETNRLELQLKFMEDNPDVGVCSGSMEVFGTYSEVWRLPETHADICAEMLFKNKICHPAVMIRRAVLSETGYNYSGPFEHLEDYYLWHRLKHKTHFHNLPDILIKYRMEGQNITVQNRHSEVDRVLPLVRYILGELGVDSSDRICRLHYFGFDAQEIRPDKQSLRELKSHLEALVLANDLSGIYDKTALKQVIRKRWMLSFDQILLINPRVLPWFWLMGRRITWFQLKSALIVKIKKVLSR